MAEWLKAHAWKACILERVSRVRIPVSPPCFQYLASSLVADIEDLGNFSRPFRLSLNPLGLIENKSAMIAIDATEDDGRRWTGTHISPRTNSLMPLFGNSLAAARSS